MPEAPQSKNTGCIAATVVAVMFAGMLFVWTCFTKVPANTIGVRTLANGGIEKKDYGPGYVLCVKGLHQVKLWDPTWSNAYQHMEVRGSDQYRTTVDVSVIYRIHKDKCHEVAGTFQNNEHIKNRVLTSLSQYANEILTQMKTEDFYNAKIRDQKTEQMQKLMDTDLERIGLEIKSVLLRNIIYDPTYEQQLLKKQLAGQQRDLDDAKTKQTVGETETELIGKDADSRVLNIKEMQDQEIANFKADMDQTCNKILQDAQLKAELITAKAKAEKRTKMSKAELLRAEATAYGTSAMSKVYAKPGASYYFAQKAIQGLKLGAVEVNSTTFNPLDTEKLLKALGLDLKHSAAAPPKPEK